MRCIMLGNVGAVRTPKPAQLKEPILEILAEGKPWQFMVIVTQVATYLYT